MTLTVKSLEAGLDNGDNISELKARLDETPADLQGLYLATLRNVEPRYRWQAADLLRIIGHAESPPTLLGLAFASDGPTSAIAQDIRPVRDDTKLLTTCRVMEKRLGSRCGALLDIGKAPSRGQESNEGTYLALDRISPRLQDEGSSQVDYMGSEESEIESNVSSGQRSYDGIPMKAAMMRAVDFLHVSVLEFLNLPTSWQVLEADRTSIPDPYINLISSHVSLLNLDDRPWTGTGVESGLPRNHPGYPFRLPYSWSKYLIRETMRYGLKVREDSSGTLVALLDRMHATMTEYSSLKPQPWFIHLLDYADCDDTAEVPLLKWPKRWHSDFLALAA